MNYKEQYDHYLKYFNDHITQYCERYLPSESLTASAAKYSLMNGGKRVRAVFMLAVCDAFGGDLNAAMPMAAAIEMLHCYSLIHDDLPCMDDDDYRRGQLSCHKKFDYATALLAGDLLLTESFHILADNSFCSAAAVAQSVKMLSGSAGSAGMVFGQELDLKYENTSADLQTLQKIDHHKTGCLINASIQLGRIAAGNDDILDEKRLSEFAFSVGLVFQIIDDILDVTSSQEVLGKPIGSDNENHKSTYVSLLGTEKAFQYASDINTEACRKLKDAYGDRFSFLISFSNNLLVRKN